MPTRTHSEPVATQGCEVCGSQFQYGAHVYDGKHVRAYGITVCRRCYDANWDGWGPFAEPAVLRKASENGLPLPPRNAKGWLPRDG
jgi:hypothetical protein